MVKSFIKDGYLPYQTKEGGSYNLEYFREFEILDLDGLRRFDLMIVNHTSKRYDILEFKNRPLMLKDCYQVYGYMKAFMQKFYFGKAFNKDYKYCFHLIGYPSNDERIGNLVLMQSPVFKIHYNFSGNEFYELYEQCPEVVLMCRCK